MDSYPERQDVLRLLLEKMDKMATKVAGIDAKITTMSKLFEDRQNQHAACEKCLQHVNSAKGTETVTPEETSETVDSPGLDAVDGADTQHSPPAFTNAESIGVTEGEVELRHKDKTGSRRRARQRSTGDNKGDRLGRALQENIVTIVENVPFSCCELADLIINAGCVTEDECTAIRKCPNPKDEMRNVVRLIKGRSYGVIKSFLDCVEKFNPDVTKTVWNTFKKNKHVEFSKTLCTFCRLKRSVNIRLIADHVWSIGAISDELYEEVVSYNHSDKSLDSVWKKLATECNQHIHNKPIVEKIVQALTSKGHYSHIIKDLKRESELICRCDVLGAIFENVMHRRLASQEDLDKDDDDSTVSPRSSIGDTETTEDDSAQHTDTASPIVHAAENTHFHFVLPKYTPSSRKSILTTVHLEDTIDELEYYCNDTWDHTRSNSVGKDYRKRKDINVNLNRRRASLPGSFS